MRISFSRINYFVCRGFCSTFSKCRGRRELSNVKWTFLQHNGPYFPPPYKRLPDDVKFYYDGTEIELSVDAEEMATFYAKLIEHEYVTKHIFNENFMKDWRSRMTGEEKELLVDLDRCDFTAIHRYFVVVNEKKKAASKEDKQKIKQLNDEINEKHGYCVIDGVQEKIANFKIEPPGLFRGRGDHPKMGMLKSRIEPEDVIINCSPDSVIPLPPEGRHWKDIKHDNTVTWLACWTENISSKMKYVWLNQASKLHCEKDQQKYDLARKLSKYVKKIRKDYLADLKSDDVKIRQRAVALYFIDKLALRVGNEKDDDEADTVGCCSLRVEHVQLHETKDGVKNVVIFDFLGKDSVRYYNEISVLKLVFNNLRSFCKNKAPSDELFDKLNTNFVNKYLNELMPGLTTKVFRTYNASHTLQEQLDQLTDDHVSIAEKILQYNRANRTVAVLCNHQKTIPKTFEKSMDNLNEKLSYMQKEISDLQTELESGAEKNQKTLEKKQKKLNKLKEQLAQLNLRKTNREENKSVALGTSKLNYLDPRITVSWCRKHNVPVEKIYNKTQQSKFKWAVDAITSDFKF